MKQRCCKNIAPSDNEHICTNSDDPDGNHAADRNTAACVRLSPAITAKRHYFTSVLFALERPTKLYCGPRDVNQGDVMADAADDWRGAATTLILRLTDGRAGRTICHSYDDLSTTEERSTI